LSARRVALAVLALVLATAAVVLWYVAPPSPFGARVQTFASPGGPLLARFEVSSLSDRQLPRGFGQAHLEGFFTPPGNGSLTLVLEVTGGARLVIDDQVTETTFGDNVQRKLLEVPAGGPVPLSLDYVPGRSQPLLRILHWDRAHARVQSLPGSWVRPSLCEVGASATTRQCSRIAALVMLLLALLVARAAVPPATSVAHRGHVRVAGAAIAVLTLVYLITILGRVWAHESPIKGDAHVLVDATRSLIEDHDLDLRGQASLHLYEPGGPNVYLSEADSVVALGKNGAMYPKHAWLFALLGAPWYGLGGTTGLVVWNAILLVVLGAAMYAIAAAAGVSPVIAGGTAVLLGLSPLVIVHTYAISIDVLGAALSMAGFALVLWRRPGLGGLLIGASLLARITYAPIAAAAFLALNRWRHASLLIVGLAVPLCALGVMNWHMFGGPLEMSYNHVLVMVNGERAVAGHGDLFDRSLIQGALEQMFEMPRGLIVTAPLAVLAWLGLPRLVRQAGPLALGSALAAVVIYVLFAIYVYGEEHPFVRFLLPLVGLAAAPLASLLEWCASRHRRPADVTTPGE
jgi:hypothetical protein